MDLSDRLKNRLVMVSLKVEMSAREAASLTYGSHPEAGPASAMNSSSNVTAAGCWSGRGSS